LLAASAVAGINFAIVAVLPEDEFQEMLRKLCIAAGASVGAVWLVLALGKLCRSEGGWIDRLGRVLGACWILVFFTAILSDFWWTSITSKNNQEAFQRFKSIPKGEKLYQESYESVPEAAKSGQKLNREPDVANRGIEEPQREPKLPHRPVDGATRSAPDVKPGTGAKEP
ncbi:MAG TPA: hypothetical protein VGZ22_20240, partial [Isosphaeraceae bacterium]|nr:hypothetical protein [Isosphaeraceae bacterium]